MIASRRRSGSRQTRVFNTAGCFKASTRVIRNQRSSILPTGNVAPPVETVNCEKPKRAWDACTCGNPSPEAYVFGGVAGIGMSHHWVVDRHPNPRRSYQALATLLLVSTSRLRLVCRSLRAARTACLRSLTPTSKSASRRNPRHAPHAVQPCRPGRPPSWRASADPSGELCTCGA
jgi:hypothetical protein